MPSEDVDVIGLAYLFAGFFILAVVWLPLILRGSVLTLPIFAVLCGFTLVWVVGWQSPLKEGSEYLPALTRTVLLFAVMEAGLKIDRRFSCNAWASTWRLLFVVMPLNIIGAALLAMLLLPASLGVRYSYRCYPGADRPRACVKYRRRSSWHRGRRRSAFCVDIRGRAQ